MNGRYRVVRPYPRDLASVQVGTIRSSSNAESLVIGKKPGLEWSPIMISQVSSNGQTFAGARAATRLSNGMVLSFFPGNPCLDRRLRTRRLRKVCLSAQKIILFDSLGIILAILVPTIVATLVVA